MGKATKEKGYEEADVYDSEGNVTQGLGGGNCQISSTLYNAVLSVPELEVVETEPGIKGDTASNVTKSATVETGAVVQVPLFINQGDKIKIDTRTGEYLSRV